MGIALTVGEAAVDTLTEERGDVGIAGWGGLSGEVGRGTDKGVSKGMQQLLAEIHAGDADADGAVVGGQVVCDGDGEPGGREHHSGGSRVVEQQVGDSVRETGQEHVGRGEDEHGLVAVAFLDGIESVDGIGECGIAAYAPDGVGRVEECLSGTEGLEGGVEGGVLHGRKRKNRGKDTNY